MDSAGNTIFRFPPLPMPADMCTSAPTNGTAPPTSTYLTATPLVLLPMMLPPSVPSGVSTVPQSLATDYMAGMIPPSDASAVPPPTTVDHPQLKDKPAPRGKKQKERRPSSPVPTRRSTHISHAPVKPDQTPPRKKISTASKKG
ncbi:hypothetical protein BD779DRAFT_1679223 [Infundibulicybe gibba]|nr:hypothetical protein BD779DRAFT_1679223 [Infundibulicybe gibba]